VRKRKLAAGRADGHYHNWLKGEQISLLFALLTHDGAVRGSESSFLRQHRTRRATLCGWQFSPGV